MSKKGSNFFFQQILANGINGSGSETLAMGVGITKGRYLARIEVGGPTDKAKEHGNVQLLLGVNFATQEDDVGGVAEGAQQRPQRTARQPALLCTNQERDNQLCEPMRGRVFKRSVQVKETMKSKDGQHW